MRCTPWKPCGPKSVCRMCQLGRRPTRDGWSEGQSGIRITQGVASTPDDAPDPARRGLWWGNVSVEPEIGRPYHPFDLLSMRVTPYVRSREEAVRLTEEWMQAICPSSAPLAGTSRRRRSLGCRWGR